MPWLRVMVPLLVALLAPAAAAAPPSALVATSATRSVVKLSWTAGEAASTRFAVERKPLGASWTPPPPPAKTPVVTTMVDGTTVEDSAIDPFTTYVYRVRAVAADQSLSAASNEITVGPPPIGFSQVVQALPSLADADQFARGVSITLDGNEDPAAAYLITDPDNNGDAADTTLHFICWNRARYRWNAPVQIALVGISDWNLRAGLSLAHDASTGRWGLAHMVGDNELRLALSEDGAAWRELTIVKLPENETLGGASLVLGKGRLFLAYDEAADDGKHGVRFRSGLQTDPLDKWTSKRSPVLPGTWDSRRSGISLALDAAGAPAVALWLNPAEGYNVTLGFWRPETNALVKVADSQNFQSDSSDARLAIRGRDVAAAYYVRRTERFFDIKDQVWVSRSSDEGATWTPPVALPSDGNASMGPPLDLAMTSKGRPVVTAWVDGGNNTGVKCGQPKIIRQTDTGGWSTCAPDTKGTPTLDARLPSIRMASNDKLYVVFKTTDTAGGLKPGLALWRER